MDEQRTLVIGSVVRGLTRPEADLSAGLYWSDPEARVAPVGCVVRVLADDGAHWQRDVDGYWRLVEPLELDDVPNGWRRVESSTVAMQSAPTPCCVVDLGLDGHAQAPAPRGPFVARPRPPRRHVDPREAGLDAGLAPNAHATRSGVEGEVLEVLVASARDAMGKLLGAANASNAPRVFTQLGKLALGIRKTLVLFGDAPLAEELEGLLPRARRDAMLGPGATRETQGVHALNALVAEWRKSRRPGEIRELLQAVELLEAQKGRVMVPRNSPSAERDELDARINALRARAEHLMSAMLAEAADDVSSQELARHAGTALAGIGPDDYEELGAHLPTLAQGMGPPEADPGAWDASMDEAMDPQEGYP